MSRCRHTSVMPPSHASKVKLQFDADEEVKIPTKQKDPTKQYQLFPPLLHVPSNTLECFQRQTSALGAPGHKPIPLPH